MFGPVLGSATGGASVYVFVYTIVVLLERPYLSGLGKRDSGMADWTGETAGFH